MTERLNQMALVERVAARAGVSPKVAEDVLKAAFDIISHQVTSGGKVAISNFGTWTSKKTRAYLAHNPQTMEKVQVPEHQRPVFLFAPRIRGALQAGIVLNDVRKRSSR